MVYSRLILVFLISLSCYSQGKVDRFTRFATESATEASNPLIWYSATKQLQGLTDNADIGATITDYGSAGCDATSIGTANILAHEASDGFIEFEHDGTDAHHYRTSSCTASDLDPDVDAFTVMVVLGDLGTTGTDNYVLQRGSTGSSVTQTQYGYRFVSTTGVRENAGGVQANTNTISATQTAQVLIMVVVDQTDVDTFIDDVAGNGFNPGTYTSTNQLRIGSRSNSLDTSRTLAFDGSWREIAIWDRVLTAQEITDITNEHEVL